MRSAAKRAAKAPRISESQGRALDGVIGEGAEDSETFAVAITMHSGGTVDIAPKRPLLDRLICVQRAAQQGQRQAESAALNGVIVALSEAKHKAREARGAVDVALYALLDELEAL